MNEYIDREDFLREFGKYMLHTLRQKRDQAKEHAEDLRGITSRRLHDLDLAGAVATSEAMHVQEAHAEAFQYSISCLFTSAAGLGIEKEELEI